MRKLTLAATLAVLGAALLATSASAFDHHFVVRMKYISSHTIGHRAFVRKDKLVDFHNRQDRVGRDRWRCRVVKGHTGHLKCKALIHLNGEIGGKGYIRVRGDIEHKDDHLVVLGGTRQFDGARARSPGRASGFTSISCASDLVRLPRLRE